MNLLVITGKNNFIGQTRKPWVSINTDAFISNLKDYGYSIELTDFFNTQQSINNIKNNTIFYTFTQKNSYRKYIKDIIYELSENNLIIPGYDMLMCHENKGYQEILRKRLGIKGLQSFYLSSLDDINNIDISFPIVMKTVDGSNGKGVFLCKSKDEIKEIYNKLFNIHISEKIDLFRRKHLRKNKTYEYYPEYSNQTDYLEYKEYITPDEPFVLQEFVPDQEYDFRVLAIYDKYFVMKRHNRKNDFRASGAKMFDTNFEPDTQLLTEAYNIMQKIDTPYLSMDFIFDKRNKTYKLIEFQALHFGITAILKNNHHYKYSNKNWEQIEEKLTFEEQLAYGLHHFIKGNS